jgi:hypothetical protein
MWDKLKYHIAPFLLITMVGYVAAILVIFVVATNSETLKMITSLPISRISLSLLMLGPPLLYPMLVAVIKMRSDRETRWDNERGKVPCYGCGYDCRASHSRCPECGRSRF